MERVMQTSDVTADRLRHLAEMEHSEGRVLSLYLNLEPTTFGVGPARSTAIRSLLDDASRRIRSADDLTHAEQAALRQDLERAEQFFADDFSAEGAHGLAVFACGPRGVFEVMRLARPVDNGVHIDGAPWIAPLARQFSPDGWAVLLVSRSAGRILRGTVDHLDEQQSLHDDVHGQHDQGGWSQARYQRSVDQDASEHIARVLAELKRQHLSDPIDHLLIAASDETWGFVESHLDPDLRARLCGRIDVQVEECSADQVFAEARRAMLDIERRRERELLDTMEQRLAMHGRAAGDLDSVLDALVQRRVESLLLDDNAHAEGVRCPFCGWMGRHGERCPADGRQVDHRPDIVEDAVESALLQSAEIVYVRQHDDLRAHGGVGAVLRF
jgi:peptide chain release factor subunit 1